MNLSNPENISEIWDKTVSSKSRFCDDIWLLDVDVTRANRKIDWGIKLGKYGSLTDSAHTNLLTHCKSMYYLALNDDYGLYRRAKPSSVVSSVLSGLKPLLEWMANRDILDFNSLDLATIAAYRQHIDTRTSKSPRDVGKPPKPLGHSTRKTLLHPIRLMVALEGRVLQTLPGDRNEILDATLIESADFGEARGERIPDDIANELFTAAIDFVEKYSDGITRAYAASRSGWERSSARDSSSRSETARREVHSAMRGEPPVRVGDTFIDLSMALLKELAKCVRLLEAACFIILSGLVGLRISESGSLEIGCLSTEAIEHGKSLLLIHGRIFKTTNQASINWQWCAGWDSPQNPVRRAIECLEALRKVGGAKDGYLFVEGRSRASNQGELDALLASAHTERVNVFATAFGITRWVFASHQFRRTFARFVTKRDNTTLLALKLHFGHVSIQMTEHYAYWDDDLIQEVLDADLEQDLEALDAVLRSDTLAGKMGEQILQTNERFRGVAGVEARRVELERIKDEVCDDPMIVLRHEYGYCIFLSDQARCGGERWKVGVDTCIGCKNFVVSQTHLPWWQRQVAAIEESMSLKTFTLMSEPVKDALAAKLVRSKSIVKRLEA